VHIEQVAKGEGKGWAKGRKASNDPRIARNAEARRGLRYLRHIPLEQDKRVRYHRASTIEWNARMSYAVGLAATDGCLYRDKRHINFTSEDAWRTSFGLSAGMCTTALTSRALAERSFASTSVTFCCGGGCSPPG